MLFVVLFMDRSQIMDIISFSHEIMLHAAFGLNSALELVFHEPSTHSSRDRCTLYPLFFQYLYILH